MAATTYRTRLDEDGCIDLLRILQVVNQIDQEQAWAICYEVCTLMKSLVSSAAASRCVRPIQSLGQIHLHKEGHVHEKSCLGHGSWRHQHQQKLSQRSHHHNNNSNNHNNNQDQQAMLDESGGASNESGDPSPTRTPTSPSPNQSQSQSRSQSPICSSSSSSSSSSPTMSQTDEPTRSCPSAQLNQVLKRRPALNESELVASLGIALFWALDYGIPNDEERTLGIAMEYLIFQSQSELTFDQVLELCVKRLPPTTRTRADSHYRSVCKSLVQDTIQLSIFLEKIYTASMVLSDISEQELGELGEPLASLRALKIDDWARLWMHVIKELKQALAIT